MKKKDGSLCLCIDYQGINNITISNKYLLLLINDLLKQTKRAIWLTKLDLKNRYNLIRIALEDEWKTAFRTPKGLFEYTVMLFVLWHRLVSLTSVKWVVTAEVIRTLAMLQMVRTCTEVIECEIWVDRLIVRVVINWLSKRARKRNHCEGKRYNIRLSTGFHEFCGFRSYSFRIVCSFHTSQASVSSVSSI